MEILATLKAFGIEIVVRREKNKLLPPGDYTMKLDNCEAHVDEHGIVSATLNFKLME